jgi:hypothetical protein
MRIRLFILAGLILSAATMAAAGQDESISFTRSTIEAVILKSPPKSPVQIYEDKDFAFYKPAAQTAPGFFINNKRLKKWIEVKKLSTESAKLGRLSSGEEVKPAVEKKHYVELPLKTGKSISYPGKITYDSEAEVYGLEFDSWQNKKEFVTRFWIDREDLEDIFAKAR